MQARVVASGTLEEVGEFCDVLNASLRIAVAARELSDQRCGGWWAVPEWDDHRASRYDACILISMSTPAGRSRRWSDSTVLLVGSTMSRRRLWMRISKCSRESLSTCGDRTTQNRRTSVGSGTGPRTFAWVRTTVSTIFFVD